MTRYRFRGIFLLLLMGHATACATMTSTKPVYGSIPEFIEETQPDRVHITTEDGTVYEVTRPFVEGDKIVSVDSISVPIADIVELEDAVAMLRCRWDHQINVALGDVFGLLRGFLKTINAAFLLGRPGLWSAADPVQFTTQELLPLMVLDLRRGMSGRASLQILGVVSLVTVGLATVKIDDPRCQSIQKEPVVRHEDTAAPITA